MVQSLLAATPQRRPDAFLRLRSVALFQCNICLGCADVDFEPACAERRDDCTALIDGPAGLLPAAECDVTPEQVLAISGPVQDGTEFIEGRNRALGIGCRRLDLATKEAHPTLDP